MSDAKRDPRDGRTPEDIKNGWSFEDWLAYHQERTSAAAEKIDPLHPNRRVRPSRANGPRWNFPARRSRIKKFYVFRSQFDVQVYPDLSFIENNGRGGIAFGTCSVVAP